MSTFETFEVPKYFDVEPKVFVRRTDLHPSMLAAEASPLGWDLISTVSLPIINKDLKESNTYPKIFDLEDSWLLSGRFKPWYISTGGSGAILFIKTPISEARVEMPGIPAFSFGDGEVTIGIKLDVFQHLPNTRNKFILTAAESSGESLGTPQYLMARTKSDNINDPVASIYQMDFGDATPTKLQETLFKGAMEAWFNDNLDEFGYIFSTVYLNAIDENTQFQWTAPTYCSYAFYNGDSEATSYFGVLCKVNNDSPEGLTNQLSGNLIPPGYSSSIVISNRLLLLDIIMPGLVKSFKDASLSDFKIIGNNEVIENINDITLPDLKVDDKEYTPIAEKFTLQVIGDELQINLKIKINIKSGVDLYIISTSYYNFELIERADGGRTLDFKEAKLPEVTSWQDIADSVIVTEILAKLIESIKAGISNETAKDISNRIAAVAVIGLVAGISKATSKLIDEVLNGKAATALPSIDDFVREASRNVKWGTGKSFQLRQLELNGALVLLGSMK